MRQGGPTVRRTPSLSSMAAQVVAGSSVDAKTTLGGGLVLAVATAPMVEVWG
jgi:hypothetical protein